MTLANEVKVIFNDAHAVHEASIERLEAGDIRDAAEKAWCATLRATNALLYARCGELPEKTPFTSRGLDKLIHLDSSVKTLEGRYYSRQSRLHGDCFYLGMVDDMEGIERRIRETLGYIEDAERLADTTPVH